jgi:hypothetical protein
VDNRGCVRTMETVASAKTTTAAAGIIFRFINLILLFGVGDPSVVHVGDGIGKMKNAIVMCDHDNGAIRFNRGAGEKFHNGFAGGVVERRRRFVANN